MLFGCLAPVAALHGQMSPEELSIVPKCGAIIRTGSGTDNVPVKAATKLGIVVANTPDALNDAVSDHAIGLLFAVIRQIALQDRNVRNRIWDRTRGFQTGISQDRPWDWWGLGESHGQWFRSSSDFR